MATRLKNIDWQPGNNSAQADSWERVQIAILLDLRDELQKLNTLLHCHNAVDIPNILRRIDTNTHKVKRSKKAR
jgi:hypothetical protein